MSESVVLDHGSATVKAGFGGEDWPRSIFPTLLGRPKAGRLFTSATDHHHQHRHHDEHQKLVYVGEEAQNRRDLLHCRSPIENGLITNWDDMETVWHHAFYDELRMAPEERPVLLTEGCFNPKQSRERTTEIMFETLHVPAMYLQLQQVLAMYCVGRTTGLTLDCGGGVAHAVTIADGYNLPHALRRLDVSGDDLTGWMLACLQEERGDPFGGCTTAMARELACSVKERCGYVALDYEAELARCSSSSTEIDVQCELPDGRRIRVGSERFRCPELLFRPGLMGGSSSSSSNNTDGVATIVYNSISACELDLSPVLYRNIVLTGGCTLFPGFAVRLQQEVSALSYSAAQVNVTAYPERSYSVWLGGSILASLSTFTNMWVSRADYDETGAAIIHSKCF